MTHGDSEPTASPLTASPLTDGPLTDGPVPESAVSDGAPTGSSPAAGPATGLARTDSPPTETQFRPGDDVVPTHTVEFLRVEGNDALVKYVPGDYVPRGALPALAEVHPAPGSRASARNSRRRPTPVHALLGMLFWVVTVVLFVIGIALAIGGDYGASRIIAYIAMGTSVVGILLGGIAVVLRRGRELGIVAMVLCLVSNPLVLAELLGWVTDLTA